MKKLFITLAVMTLAIFAANAEEKTKSYNFGDIRSLNIGYMYEVVVTEGTSDAVEVVYDSKFEEYLKVNYSSDSHCLNVSMKDNLPKMLKTGQLPRIKVYLEMDMIADIDVSGAAAVTFKGEFKSDKADIELSGASKINDLKLNGKSLDFSCSGASKGSVSGDFSEDVEIELSGASKASYTGNCKSLNAELSGASKIEMNGSADNVEYECSGASKIEAKKFVAKDAMVTLSGASTADVHATDHLTYSVSRACRITYYGDAFLKNISPENNVVKGKL
ncbi:MAG: DUF2807 domain-containing protein [Bacteroidales bacterium]|nr:DUF2807 domain-containing protein [Bacteroidales bacterium]